MGEAHVLAQNDIRLLPIYQRTTGHPGVLAGPIANGTADANAALAAAKSLGVPSGKGIALCADIEAATRPAPIGSPAGSPAFRAAATSLESPAAPTPPAFRRPTRGSRTTTVRRC